MMEAIVKAGSCTVYAAALEAGCSAKFRSAVVVNRSSSTQFDEEIFRDDCLEDGQVWRQPEQALALAIDVGIAAACAYQTLDLNKVLQLSLLPKSS